MPVTSVAFTVNFATDGLGFNNFTTAAKPATTVKLEYTDGSNWIEITESNYLTAGVVGLSSTPCMKNTSLDALRAFTMTCSALDKFGINVTG